MMPTPDFLLPSSLTPDFNYAFNYASWDADTELTLTNVPWNSDYRDIVVMNDQTALNTWLDAQTNVRLRNATEQKFNEGIVKIDLPLNEAMKFNYLRARNGTSPVSSATRDYFYFITGIRYGAPDTTYVSIQLDVISTFFYEVQFGNCYVERGHIGIANQYAFSDYGRQYLTVPEGLDLGGEYRTVHVEFQKVMDPAGDADVDPGYDVLVCSTLDLTQDPGDVSNPSLKSATGGSFQGLPTGASFYLFRTGYDLRTFFQKYSDKPWITQSIISITLIPNMSRFFPGYDYGTNLSTDASFKFYEAGSSAPNKHAVQTLPNWRSKDFIGNILGPAFSKLKKFLTYPYSIIEMTTWSGSPLIIKPEAWQDENATVVEMAAFMPPGQRVGIMPYRYNWDPETDTSSQHHEPSYGNFEDFGEFLDFAVWLSDFPQLPVVNNSAIAFLANNKNGLAFSFSSADWTQQRALSGAQAASDVQGFQIGNMARQSSIGNRAQTDTSALMATTAVGNSIIGAAGSVPGMAAGAAGAGSVAEGVAGAGIPIAGAAVGMITAGQNANASLQAAQISVGARGESAISDIQTAGSTRDTNLTFAQYAAKGDYANAIAGVQAKIQDARMMQPSTSGQFGGDAFNLINGKFGYSLRWKMPNLNALRTLGNYWLRYGYAINQFIAMPASLHCMSKFTYWKLSETYISQGAFPEGFKQIIRGVFEKGVTVWKNPADIGRTNLADNQPLEGIAY